MAEDVTQTVEVEPAEESIAKGAEPREVSPEERIQALETALVKREARIREMEQALAQRDATVREMEAALAQVEASLGEREDEVKGVKAQLAQAVALYRASLLAAEPEIPQELVQGTTAEEIEASLARARQMVEQVRSQLEARASQERVPFGAPVRSAPDLSALSPQEKILYGLSRR